MASRVSVGGQKAGTLKRSNSIKKKAEGGASPKAGYCPSPKGATTPKISEEVMQINPEQEKGLTYQEVEMEHLK